MTAWTDRSESIDALAAAWVAASAEMHDIAKTQTAQTGKYSYSYATLADAFGMARPVLARHGLVLTQTAATIGDEVAISTTILHASGQWVTAAPLTLPVGDTAQQTGSAVTYARRYALMSMLGLATEDDDGASAAPRTSREAARSPRERRSEPSRVSTSQAPRTDEEREMRELLGTLSKPEQARVRDEFIAAFGTSLKDLEPDLHGPALLWMREAVEMLNNSDAAWVQEATA